ncbi:MAG: hypothetical protein KY458_09475 [Actinobacteria bacterium]|nr:hypothetical protein [Actinomycetota bacterium]
MDLAGQEAVRLGDHRLGTEHLLVGLVLERESRAASALEAAGATIYAVRDKVAEAVGRNRPEAAAGEVTLTPRAQRALERAIRFSVQARLPDVEPEQVLLGVLDVEGIASQVLRGLGVDVAALARAMASPAPAEVPEVAPGAPDAPASAGTEPPPPRCANCGAGLGPALRWHTMAVAGEAGVSRDFVVAYCSACGAAIGATPSARPSSKR